MAYREEKVYDGPFPTYDQIISGDPAAPPSPQEVWLHKVNKGEFAVRYKDFKTGLARNPQGKPVQGSEICRIFDNLAEARSDSKQISKSIGPSSVLSTTTLERRWTRSATRKERASSQLACTQQF